MIDPQYTYVDGADVPGAADLRGWLEVMVLADRELPGSGVDL